MTLAPVAAMSLSSALTDFLLHMQQKSWRGHSNGNFP